MATYLGVVSAHGPTAAGSASRFSQGTPRLHLCARVSPHHLVSNPTTQSSHFPLHRYIAASQSLEVDCAQELAGSTSLATQRPIGTAFTSSNDVEQLLIWIKGQVFEQEDTIFAVSLGGGPVGADKLLVAGASRVGRP